jgi:hypothetical protein
MGRISMEPFRDVRLEQRAYPPTQHGERVLVRLRPHTRGHTVCHYP